ncbi:MAG TPA: SusC/RagA family TonB-linked outer membrane protein [Puia sp.]
MTRLKFTLFVFLQICSCIVFGQDRTITGKITEEANKAPIAGATISIKGSRKAVTTNADGVFSISVPAGTTLVVSSIGFATKEIVAKATSGPINVELGAESKQMGEVVVTALGITRQAKTLVYATQTVKPKELTEVRDPNNVLNSLAGKVANAVVTQGSGGPGSGARIVLRGNKSIQGDNNALLVVDGVPINNTTFSTLQSDLGDQVQTPDGASNINPDDIESMTVLRGASAAALYGSQAANGVIVITTKKGKKNAVSVNVNSGIAFEKTFALPAVQNTYGQGIGGVQLDSLGSSWGAKMTGQPYTDYLGKPASYSAQPNNIKDFFRTGVSTNNYIGLSAGGDKAQTYLSYTNNDIQGIIPKNDLMRHIITLRETLQINKKFSADAKVTYISQNIKNMPRTGEKNATVMDLYQIPRNVSLGQAKQSEVTSTGVPVPTYWPTTLSGIYQNPYWMINRTSLNDTRDRVMGFVSAKYQLTPWLSLKGDANLDKTFDGLEQIYSQGTVEWVTQAGGYYQKTNVINTQKWFDAIFEGSNTITQDLKVTYHAGAIYQDIASDVTQNTADGLNVVNKFSLNYASNPAVYTNYIQTQTHSVFGQATFSFKNAIFLDASLRNDWASPLPAPYSYQYPSIGASAVLSDLMHLPSAISFLKASINYASVGNGGQPQILTSTYNYSQGSGNGFIGRSTINPVPSLKPEITRSLEFGIDSRFLHDRLGFTLTYYKSNSINQLLLVNLPTPSGYAQQYINAGNIQNQGLELVLNATPIKSKDLTWDIAANLSLNRNKIVRLSQDLKITYLGGGYMRSGTPVIQEGGSYGDLLGYGWLKDSKGNRVVDASGMPVATPSEQYLGNFNPREVFGLTNTFTYKRFNLRVLIDGRIGGVLVSGTEMNMAFSGITKATEKYRNGGWSLGGVDASGNPVTKTISAQDFWTTPAVSGKRYGGGEFFTYDATNIRVRELSIGYDIPVGTGLLIKAARFSAVARNLLWIYRGSSILDIPGLGKRKMWMDPDMSLGNGNYQGVEYGTMPATRTLGFNLSLTF